MASPPPVPRHFLRTEAGFHAQSMVELLHDRREVIDRIRLTIGLDAADFEKDVQRVIQAYARFVHLLPATASAYFDRPGGLLELGLEVGFFALQGTDAHIFSGQSSISTRRVLEPRWRYATFLAGLCCELHRPLTCLVVAAADGREWTAYRHPLADWLEAGHVDRYFVRWRPKATDARGAALFALPHILTPSTLEYLDEGRSSIVPHLLASIAGLPVYREHNVLDHLVRRSLSLVVERDLQAAADWHGATPSSPHLERHLVDALRGLATSEPSWRPNQDRSRVWHGPDGVFIGWPHLAADLRSQLERDRISGIPKSPETMLQLLLAAGIADPCSPLDPTWSLLPPGAKAPVVAVRLASASLLWDGSATEHALLDRPVSVAPRVPPTAPVPPPAVTKALDQDGQLPLLDPEVACTASDPERRSTRTDDRGRSGSHLALQAPMRLNALVRDALTSIIDTMNGPPPDRAACVVANGIFVPLAELSRRGVQPTLALRTLGELSLLVMDRTQRAPTVTHTFAGTPQQGLVLDPSCVSGLEVSSSVLTAPGAG
jgi:conjugal transfer pilus assembly protein TraI